MRNADGRATDDAIRSMVISHKLLGAAEWFVIHHTDCGMLFFSDDTIGELLAGSLETAELKSEGFRNASDGGGSPRAATSNGIPSANREPPSPRRTAHPRPPAGQPEDPGLRLCL